MEYGNILKIEKQIFSLPKEEQLRLIEKIIRHLREDDLKKAKKELHPRFNSWLDGEEINVEEYIMIRKIVENAGGLQMSGEITQEQLREKINEILAE